MGGVDIGQSTVTIRARAPVRIDFAGGWSDVPEFADAETGAVVNAAITRYVHVEARSGGGSYRFIAEDLGERVFFKSPTDVTYDGKLDLHKAALNMLPVTGGVEVISRADVPAGSGLGASGSLDVALLLALARCRLEEYDPAELAEMGFLLETSELRLAGGRQDQLAAALGGFHHFTFGGGSPVTARALAVSPDAAEDLARHTSVFYTGQSHFSSQTHNRVWTAFREDRDGVRDAIRAMRDLVAPMAEAFEAGRWEEVARGVDANWEHQQRLDATIATERTQAIETAVRAHGAWGMKETGAGAGGCLVVLGPADKRAAIREAAEEAGGRWLDWAFDFEGATTWDEKDDADSGTG